MSYKNRQWFYVKRPEGRVSEVDGFGKLPSALNSLFVGENLSNLLVRV